MAADGNARAVGSARNRNTQLVSNDGTMLEVRSLTKYYGALPALRDASFIAKPGQILGYLGPNGSGKSTTVRMLVGLMEPTSGEVLWQGKSIFDDMPAYRRRLGYVPEEPFLYTHLTAPEYLRLVGGLRGIEDAVLNEKIDRFLQLFGLEDDRYSTLSAFSKGMRQKVQIASALMHNPELIVLDEPFSGLDVSAGLMLRSVIKSLAAEGRTILMSSHVIEVVEQICTDVVILSDGKVVAHDSVHRLRGLQNDESLEHVFVKLAIRDNVEDAARAILDTVKL
jgi:ABC-2 type transport system ATP-binding protein